jgi:hypothetical protein
LMTLWERCPDRRSASRKEIEIGDTENIVPI